MAELLLRHVRVVDVVAGMTTVPTNVKISGGLIEYIGADSEPDDVQSLQCDGLYVSPGLIDAHVHLFFDASSDPVANYLASDDPTRLDVAARNASAALTAGITCARDLGGPPQLLELLSHKLETGQISGPHLVSSGAPLTRRGGHCHYFGGEVSTTEDIRRLIAEQAKHGAHNVKVMASGGGMTPGTRPYEADFPLEMIVAARLTAEEFEMTVTAHCHATEAIKRVVGAGIRCIEHASFMEPPGRPRFDVKVGEALAEHRVVVCPTIASGLRAASLYRRRGRADHPDDGSAIERLEYRAEVAARLHGLGVELIAGSDAGSDDTPFHVLIEEVEALVHAGLSCAEALRSATVESARHLQLGNVGVVEAGYRADLILLEGDPLSDVGAIRDPVKVIKAGVVVRNDSYSVRSSRIAKTDARIVDEED